MEDVLQTTKSWPHLLLSNAQSWKHAKWALPTFPRNFRLLSLSPQHSASLNCPICSSDEGQSHSCLYGSRTSGIRPLLSASS